MGERAAEAQFWGIEFHRHDDPWIDGCLWSVLLVKPRDKPG
jgi:hypothetical protein